MGLPVREMKQMLQKTIVLRKCLNCEGTLGIGVWPWSGQRFTVSHGLCERCFVELEQAALAAEPEPARTREPDTSSWTSVQGS